MVKFRRRIYSASQYKEYVKAAKTLDFAAKKHIFRGAWETDTGQDVEPRREDKNIKKVGSKYFYVTVDGNVRPIKPKRSQALGNGHVVVTFEG